MMDYTQALLIAAATLALGFWAGWHLGQIRGWGDAQEDAKTAEIAMQQHKLAEELLRQAKAKKAQICDPPLDGTITKPLPCAFAEQMRWSMIRTIEDMALNSENPCIHCANAGDERKPPCYTCRVGTHFFNFVSEYRRPDEMPRTPARKEAEK